MSKGVAVTPLSGVVSTPSNNPLPPEPVSAPSITPSLFASSAPKPDSIRSLTPSPSESKSNESIIPSPSVSLVGSPFCSTVSKIPSLSSSKSILSVIPSPSESKISL